MKINENFLKIESSYLFSTVAKKQREYQAAHPEADVIRLSIGDVTKPLAPAVIDAMHKAVDEMASEDTFRGYPPEYGYDFILDAIQKHDYTDRGIDIAKDEIFLSDGAKSDCGNIGDIFAVDNKRERRIFETAVLFYFCKFIVICHFVTFFYSSVIFLI